MMKRFRVNCISVTGRNVRKFKYGEVVTAENFPEGNIDHLVADGALVPIEGDEPEKEKAPVPAAPPASDDTEKILEQLPEEFRNFIKTHSIEEIKAEFTKDLEAFPESEWNDISEHDELLRYIASKMSQAKMNASDTMTGASDDDPDKKDVTEDNKLGVDPKAALNGPEKLEGKTYEEWTVPTLKDRLTEQKVDFAPSALKKDLFDLLKASLPEG